MTSNELHTWLPVRPELTLCDFVSSVELSLDSDRTGEFYDERIDSVLKEPILFWQKIKIVIGVMERIELTNVVQSRLTELHFRGVSFLQFAQDETSVNRMKLAWLGSGQVESFDMTELHRLGFAPDQQSSSVGENALWECTTATLLHEMISEWHPNWPAEKKRVLFRLFCLKTDDLGEVLIVGSSLNIVCNGRSIRA